MQAIIDEEPPNEIRYGSVNYEWAKSVKRISRAEDGRELCSAGRKVLPAMVVQIVSVGTSECGQVQATANDVPDGSTSGR